METITFILSIFATALATAIIGILNEKYLNRPQGIAANIDTFPLLFKPSINDIGVKVVITYHEEVAEYEDLYNVTVDIENLSNKNYDSFKFGIDFTNGDKTVYATATGKDRLHAITLLEIPEFSKPLEKMDLICKPFHKRDKYTVNALVSIPEGCRTTSTVNILIDGRFKIINQGTFGN
ncbi:MAG: hypothetical protein HZB23_16055 [Deltaproteobacteria bacterium]|nr:hypothetical protein [Deltaproteobacteria bacterium]